MYFSFNLSSIKCLVSQLFVNLSDSKTDIDFINHEFMTKDTLLLVFNSYFFHPSTFHVSMVTIVNV